MIATGQLATFSRRQAHDVGVSDRQLRSRVQSGILIQTGPNSFRSAMARRRRSPNCTATCSTSANRCSSAASTAAALHGFDGFSLRRPFHVLVPRHRHLGRADVRLHRTDRLEPIDRCWIDGLPVTSAVRTLIELARVLGAGRPVHVSRQRAPRRPRLRGSRPPPSGRTSIERPVRPAGVDRRARRQRGHARRAELVGARVLEAARRRRASSPDDAGDAHESRRSAGSCRLSISWVTRRRRTPRLSTPPHPSADGERCDADERAARATDSSRTSSPTTRSRGRRSSVVTTTRVPSSLG